jgi:hypothetical protein
MRLYFILFVYALAIFGLAIAVISYGDEITILYNDGTVGTILTEDGYVELLHEVTVDLYGESMDYSTDGEVVTDSYGNEAYPVPESDGDPF